MFASDWYEYVSVTFFKFLKFRPKISCGRIGFEKYRKLKNNLPLSSAGFDLTNKVELLVPSINK
jgi:hypothetical protein